MSHHRRVYGAMGAAAASLMLVGCSAASGSSGVGSSTPGQGETVLERGVSEASASPSQEGPLIMYAVYPDYYTSSAVLQSSKVSVVGKVVSSRMESGDLMSENGATPNPLDPSALVLPYTIYTVMVTSSLKGHFKSGDTLDFRILGGVLDGETYVLEEAPSLQASQTEEYLLNLSGEGRYMSPINMKEGVMRIQHGSIEPVTTTTLPPAEIKNLEKSVSVASRGS